MANWIQPLELEKIIINVFSGNPDVFGGIALMVIATLGAYFRMNGLILFMMLGIFFLMFSQYIGVNFLIIFGIIGGLTIGYSLRKIMQ